MKNNILFYFLLLIVGSFAGFFVIITGVTIIPMVVKVSNSKSLVPLFYSLSILITSSFLYLYPLYKFFMEEDMHET